ncbi:class E sortase [Microbacterium sp. YY-01]|uniref:class E sortase n=1 Tax=Microbacterium sp. YY-01 TaxID=3421634 RepID=UPI003D18053E
MTSATASHPSRRSLRRARRPRATFGSVLGELLLTAGAVVLLFVAWQMWIGDIIIGAENNARGNELSSSWSNGPAPEPPPLLENPDDPDAAPQWEAPRMEHPGEGEVVGVMRVPRFGDDYATELAGGVTRPITLDNGWIGVYDQSVMPGQEGNFSVAGHRTTWGAPLRHIDSLRLNDPIIIETEEGWYTYRFRTLEYVTPDRVDVLLPVPQVPAANTGEKYLTLTACSPLYSLAERIVAYGVFEGFQPRAEGEPDSLHEEGL